MLSRSWSCMSHYWTPVGRMKAANKREGILSRFAGLGGLNQPPRQIRSDVGARDICRRDAHERLPAKLADPVAGRLARPRKAPSPRIVPVEFVKESDGVSE